MPWLKESKGLDRPNCGQLAMSFGERQTLSVFSTTIFLLLAAGTASPLKMLPPPSGGPLATRVASADLIFIGHASFVLPPEVTQRGISLIGAVVDSVLVATPKVEPGSIVRGTVVRAHATIAGAQVSTWYEGRWIWFLAVSDSGFVQRGDGWPLKAPETIQDAERLLVELREPKRKKLTRVGRALERFLLQERDRLPFEGGPFMNVKPVPG